MLAWKPEAPMRMDKLSYMARCQTAEALNCTKEQRAVQNVQKAVSTASQINPTGSVYMYVTVRNVNYYI